MIKSILLGVVLALIQSLLSVGALRLCLKTKYFYWVWIGGIFARIMVLIATAAVITRSTHFHLMATLLSLVVATTVFLILETRVLLTD